MRSSGSIPDMRLCLDHMGIVPRDKYHVVRRASFRILLPLSRYHNVAVKLTQIIRSVDEPSPYPSLHQPMRRVVEAFGPSRTFWGSDLTTLSALTGSAWSWLTLPSAAWNLKTSIRSWVTRSAIGSGGRDERQPFTGTRCNQVSLSTGPPVEEGQR